jgi:mannose-6-phosphate isomerase-like protein (cupin superfamily)
MSEELLGGIGLTVLRVYDHRHGPDGIMAGCAHVHALTDEAYFGLAGEGAVELHDPREGFCRVPIRPGAFVQFPAGSLHRSVSTAGLEVLAIMGNAGLAERGDARIYFGPEVDAEPERYEALRALASSGLEGALERRDASARAYSILMGLWNTDRSAYQAELDRFLAVHRANVGERRAIMDAAIRDGPMRAGERALGRLAEALAVTGGTAGRWDAGDAEVRHGMCGLLRPVTELSGVA